MRKWKELSIQNEERGTSLANLSRDMIGYLGNSIKSYIKQDPEIDLFFLEQADYGFKVFVIPKWNLKSVCGYCKCIH